MTWEEINRLEQLKYKLKNIAEQYVFQFYEYAIVFGELNHNLEEWDKIWNEYSESQKENLNKPFEAIRKALPDSAIYVPPEFEIITSLGTILKFPKDGWLVLNESTGRGCWILVKNKKDSHEPN